MTEILLVLPAELVTEILSRLPVKSLLRFRCLCREWLNVIDSSAFINLHLIQNRKNCSLVVTGCFLKSCYSVDLKSLEETVELNIGSWCPDDGWYSYYGVRLWGSCNGLLCLSSFWKQVALWNSSTKKHLLLPPLSFDDDDQQFEEHNSTLDVGIGFGYDYATEDYKVVSILQHYTWDQRLTNTEVKVFSVRSNSWRRVYGFPKGWHRGFDGVLVRDLFYWTATYATDDPSISSLVAFDLRSEELHIFSLPSSEQRWVSGETSIQVINGCLSASSFRIDVGFELWIRDECGVPESWTKLISIHEPNLFAYYEMWPIQYCMNIGMLLIACPHDCPPKVIWYDFETKAIDEISIRGLPLDFYGKILLSESLVPLHGGRR